MCMTTRAVCCQGRPRQRKAQSIGRGGLSPPRPGLSSVKAPHPVCPRHCVSTHPAALPARAPRHLDCRTTFVHPATNTQRPRPALASLTHPTSIGVNRPALAATSNTRHSRYSWSHQRTAQESLPDRHPERPRLVPPPRQQPPPVCAVGRIASTPLSSTSALHVSEGGFSGLPEWRLSSPYAKSVLCQISGCQDTGWPEKTRLLMTTAHLDRRVGEAGAEAVVEGLQGLVEVGADIFATEESREAGARWP